MLVRLRAQFIAPGGGMTYPGEVVRVSVEAGERLIEQGAAVPFVKEADKVKKPNAEKLAAQRAKLADLAEEAPRVTKPADPSALKGEAKKAWLRDAITAKGGDPEGNTITALMAQYKALDD